MTVKFHLEDGPLVGLNSSILLWQAILQVERFARPYAAIISVSTPTRKSNSAAVKARARGSFSDCTTMKTRLRGR